MRATIALSFGMIFFGAGALAQQCNFKCTCANPSEGFVACPSLTQQQCEQAAARASVGGAVCTGAMSATCQTEKHVAPLPEVTRKPAAIVKTIALFCSAIAEARTEQ